MLEVQQRVGSVVVGEKVSQAALTFKWEAAFVGFASDFCVLGVEGEGHCMMAVEAWTTNDYAGRWSLHQCGLAPSIPFYQLPSHHNLTNYSLNNHRHSSIPVVMVLFIVFCSTREYHASTVVSHIRVSSCDNPFSSLLHPGKAEV